MAERRKSKRKVDKGNKDGEEKEQMTKLQKSVVNWLKRNVPTKKTKFMHSHVVEYFAAAKALDALMSDSPWATEKAKEGAELKFDYREQAIDFMADLMHLDMFHRAKKIPVADKKKKKGAETDNEEEQPPPEKKKGKKDIGKEVEKEREKKKRKIRLEMHMDQVFLDGTDAYVWLYDPTPWYYYLAGGAIVLGIIAVCLFPLWPGEMRQGVYYLSVAAAGFLVFIIVLAIIKYIVFVIVFLATAGKLKLWIFPNLTEDVGFFESFWPIYVYTYHGPKKAKDSDDEESSSEEEEEEDEKGDGAQDGDAEGSETGRDDADEENEDGADDDIEDDGDKNDDNASEKSSDGSKEFEIINKE